MNHFTDNLLVHIAQANIQVLQFGKQLTLVRPDVQLLHELRHNQECSPSTDLLTLQNITENVIAHVQHVLSLGAQQRGEHVTRTARVDMTLAKCSDVSAHPKGARFGVHLTENRSLTEEQRFLGVYDDNIEVGGPLAMRLIGISTVREVHQVGHDLVGEIELAVGQQEDLGARVLDAGQHHRQTWIFLNVLIQVLYQKTNQNN